MDQNARIQSQGHLAGGSTSTAEGSAVECARTGEARTRKFRRDERAHRLLGGMEKWKPEEPGPAPGHRACQQGSG